MGTAAGMATPATVMEAERGVTATAAAAMAEGTGIQAMETAATETPVVKATTAVKAIRAVEEGAVMSVRVTLEKVPAARAA
jgi:uncharacterized protein YbaA (DUF1428 family)